MINSGYIIAGRIPVCASCDDNLRTNPQGTGRPRTALPIRDSAEFPTRFTCVMCRRQFYGTPPILPEETRQ